MQNNLYDVFEESALQLAESIVIKSDETAEAQNTELTVLYGMSIVDTLQPKTWKYYLHVSGQYHPTDTMIQVTSLDTLETIDFTKENLKRHSATKNAYQYGTVLFKELITKYPSYRRLILGVLYPADIDVAIAAEKGTILSYPPALVEAYEHSLMIKLQNWIYDFIFRWDNTQFALSDNLYKTSFYGCLFSFLPLAILRFRLEACKTNEAHSFHIRQYLGSHSGLDEYWNYLTRQQALFLYRNIAYIEKNCGKQETFDWLVQNIMTVRGLPLAAYEMRHSTEHMPGNLKPEVVFEKVPINTAVNYDLITTYSATQVYDKEDPLARDNPVYRDGEFDQAISKLEYSQSNRLKTKLLESTVIDYSGSEHYTLADTLLHHWAWLSHKGKYSAYINFYSPFNDDLIIITTKDAFVFYTYAMLKLYGLSTDKLPLVLCRRVARMPKPTLQDVMSVVSSRRVPSTWAQEVIDRMPTILSMISTESFYELCQELQRVAMQQYWMACQEQQNVAHAQKFALITRMWTHAWIQLGSGETTFDEWFAARNIPIGEYSDDHLKATADLIISKATGVDSANAITLEDIQKAMIRMMERLSSYSVQYTSTINSSAILDAPNHTIRVDDVTGKSSHENSRDIVSRVLDSSGHQTNELDFDIGGDRNDWVQVCRPKTEVNIELNVRATMDQPRPVFTRYMTCVQRVTCDLPVISDNPRRVTQVLGTDIYLQQSLEDQTNIPDFWQL